MYLWPKPNQTLNPHKNENLAQMNSDSVSLNDNVGKFYLIHVTYISELNYNVSN